MLVALDKNGKLIDLLSEMPKRQEFFCPACKSKLQLRAGKIKIPHFAHLSLKSCGSLSESESLQHLSLKKELADWVSKTEKVETESYLAELGQTPDLLISDHVAIEIQCSRLSIERLFERTKNYHKHQYRVLWLMGEDLWIDDKLSQLQKHLLYFSRNAGFHYWELDLKKRTVRLKYLIHQNLRGKIIYLSKEFPFSSTPFLDLMRIPYQAQKLSSFPVDQDGNFHKFLEQSLHYRVPKWMKLQEIYYQQGKHLLKENFQIYWLPIGLDILTGEDEKDFCQISENFHVYYEKFVKYYEKHPQKMVFSPAFYDKINE